MFAIGEIAAFTAGSFSIIEINDHKIELKSNDTGRFWLVQKFENSDYPPVVLYHKHSYKEEYHVHFVYDQDNALLAYSEIMQHEKYIMKRDSKRRKITCLSNRQLIAAVYA